MIAASSCYPLRLDQLTILDAGPLALIDAAASFGIYRVSLWTSGTEYIEEARGVTRANMSEVGSRLMDRGVSVETIECFFLTENPDFETWKRGLEFGAEIGGRSAVAVNPGVADEIQAAEQLAAFAEIAAGFGLGVSFEPICVGATRTIAEAQRLIKFSGRADIRITIDALHLFRTGGTPADVASLDPAAIGSAQICDGPAYASLEMRGAEGSYDRMMPGAGDFPLVDFLSSLPIETMIGVEVPSRSLRLAGLSPHDRVALAVAGARAIRDAALAAKAAGAQQGAQA